MKFLFLASAFLISFSLISQELDSYNYIKFDSNERSAIDIASSIFTYKGFVILSGNEVGVDDCSILNAQIHYKRGVTGWTNSRVDIKFIDCNFKVLGKYVGRNTTNFNEPDLLRCIEKIADKIRYNPIDDPKTLNIETPESVSSNSLKPVIQKTFGDNIRIRVSGNGNSILKVAVIGKESNLCNGFVDDGQGLAELVEGELLGIYGVVERKHLEEILDEQRLAMSGLLFEDSDFAQAGCLAGAQGTVLASYGCLQGETKIQVKLVDCSTSDLYWSATGLDVSAFEVLDALRVKLSE